MKRKIVNALLIVVVLLIGISGCSNSDKEVKETNKTEETEKEIVLKEAKEDNESKNEKTIAVVPWDMSQAFAAQFAETAENEIEAKGWRSVVMDPAGDWNKEYTILQDLITQGVDGIIYTAIDADAANKAVTEVQAAGIPIIGYDCLASEGGEDASVAYDDVEGGRLAAEAVIEALNGKEDAQIIIYEEEPSISSSGKRINGFTEYIEENNPNIEIIKNRSFDRTQSGLYSWATDMITAYPDADAFFCYWSECSMATYNALQDSGAKDVFVIGYDATSEQQELMKSEGESCKLYASPGMSAVKMAKQCVKFMDEIFAGSYQRSGPEDIYMLTPPLLTVHNCQDFDVDK